MKSFAIACLLATTSYAVSIEKEQIYVVKPVEEEEDQLIYEEEEE